MGQAEMGEKKTALERYQHAITTPHMIGVDWAALCADLAAELAKALGKKTPRLASRVSQVRR